MIKKLMKNIAGYVKETLLAPGFVILEVIIDVLIPYLMIRIIDDGIDKANVDLVWELGIALAAAAMLSLVFGFLSGKFAAKASSGFARNLRRNMFYRVQGFSFSNIDKFSAASIVTRLTTDVTNVQMAFQMVIRIAVRSPLMLISSLVMAFTINAKLALIFLIMAPIVGLVLFFIIMKAHPLFIKVFKTYDKLNNTVQENISGIRVVKSYVREEHEKAKFNAVSGDIYQNFSKAERIVAFNSPVMQFAVYLCILLLSWFGARLIVAEGGSAAASAMTVGKLSTMINYATQILMSLMMLSMVMVMIIIARTSAGRIEQVLDEESDLANPENPVTKVENGDVMFEDVGFSYVGDAENLSLANANLSVRSGETVGIIGGTGSAKSTLVQLIPRLYDATRGRVLVGGRDVREYDIQTLRESVAMVLQKNVLFSGTIKDNLRWGDENATDGEMVRACKLAQADDFIQSFPDKYDTYIDQGGTNVSGGQKQRLCIARALLKKPKILILDDSTSAVDTRTDAAIRKAFLEEIPDTTKFIIAQRIASVQDADKIVVMDGGRIQAVGTHEELLASNGIYREVYESQQRGGGQDE